MNYELQVRFYELFIFFKLYNKHFLFFFNPEIAANSYLSAFKRNKNGSVTQSAIRQHLYLTQKR